MKTGDLYLASFLFLIGLMIYLCKSIATQDQDAWIVILAKGVLNGFTSLMAGSVLMLTSAPTIAVIGLAALFGTLGTEVVVKYFKKHINKTLKK